MAVHDVFAWNQQCTCIRVAYSSHENSDAPVQEYLESAKKGGELGRTAGLPYNFCFFLYRQDGSDAHSGEQDGMPVPKVLPSPPANCVS